MIDKMGRTCIELKALRLPYGDFLYNLTIVERSFTVILGPSGAGKSSMLHALTGFITPQSGQIWIGSEDMVQVAPHQRGISLLLQGQNLFQHLTVWRNVALGVAANLRLDQAGEAKVDDILQQLKIAHLANRLPGTLSAGERQRIGLARCLVQKSSILLLDEPFTGLESKLRHELHAQVHELAKTRGLTTLLVSHCPEEALCYADEIVFIQRGRVAYQGAASSGSKPCPALAAFLELPRPRAT